MLSTLFYTCDALYWMIDFVCMTFYLHLLIAQQQIPTQLWRYPLLFLLWLCDVGWLHYGKRGDLERNIVFQLCQADRGWKAFCQARVPSVMRTYVWVLIILWFCVIHLCDEDSFIIHMISDDEQITMFLHTLDMMLLIESWLINSLS